MPLSHRHHAIRSAAEAAFTACDDADVAIASTLTVVRPEGAVDYQAAKPRPELERARGLLNRRGYSVCFAGGFSAGKSTLINALAEDPDLLPTAAGECTLSITICSGPLADGRECVRVSYLSREEALRGLFLNQSRFRAALGRHAQAVAAASPDELLAILRRTIVQLPGLHRDVALPEHQRRELEPTKAAQLVAELQEFVEHLDGMRDRLGMVFEDRLEHAPRYLTYGRDGRGIGHMLLIETVTIHKRNPLFQDEQVRFIDLPGLDSTNSYARQVTLGYLKQADVVVNVLPPQGFTLSYLDIINEVDTANRGNIANKMFYAINRFDANEERDFSKDRIEMLLRDQIAGELARHGLDPTHLHATVALLDVQRLRGDQGAYEALAATCRNKLARIDAATAEPWAGIARSALSGNGVANLRSRLLEHLATRVEAERLEDIRRAITSSHRAAEVLLKRNAKAMEAALGTHQGRMITARAFTDRMVKRFSTSIGVVIDRLPELIREAVSARVGPSIDQGVALFRHIPLADATSGQMRFTGSQARLQQPHHIRQHWLDWSRQHYSDSLVEAARSVLVSPAVEAFEHQLQGLRFAEILTAIEPVPGQLHATFHQALAAAREQLEVVTVLRTEEEVFPLRSTRVQINSSFDPVWSPAVEQRFKDHVATNLVRSLHAYAERLVAVLPLYQAGVLRRFTAAVAGMGPAIEAALSAASGQPPDHLLDDLDDHGEAVRRAHLVHWHKHGLSATQAVHRLSDIMAEVHAHARS